MLWSAQDIEFLKTEYPTHGKKWCAEQLNRSVPAIRQKACDLGLALDTNSEFFKEFQGRAAKSKIGKPGHEITDEQKEKFRVTYKKYLENRTPEQILIISEAIKAHIKLHGHPKGMLGKHHSTEMKQKMSKRVKDEWADPNSKFNTDEFRQKKSDIATAMNRKRIKEKGSTYSRSKNGWYNVNGKIFYFRSGWEVVYARYMEHLLLNQKILNWDYEADTFWFEAIRRGVRSYTPDFKVFKLDTTIEYHEVKGWMDPKSKTKLNRMRIYHPAVTMKVIAKDDYKIILADEKLYPAATKIEKPTKK